MAAPAKDNAPTNAMATANPNTLLRKKFMGPRLVAKQARCAGPVRVGFIRDGGGYPELDHYERHDQHGDHSLAFCDLVEEEDVELDPGGDQLADDRQRDRLPADESRDS